MRLKKQKIEVSMVIRKSQAEVFNALIDPAITTKFWFTKSTGKLEAGKSIKWFWEMYNVSVLVNVLSVTPNENIKIQWGEDKDNQVEWQFKAISPQQTFVTIINSGFKGKCLEMIAQTNDSVGGFTMVLAGLKAYLEHGIELNLVGDKVPS